jgi:hypothetical protein
MDGSQANVPRASTVFAGALQVIKKETNEGGIEIFNPELGGTFVQSLLGKLQQQAETVAISRDGMRARFPLAKQTISEEGLKERRKAGGSHSCTSR